LARSDSIRKTVKLKSTLGVLYSLNRAKIRKKLIIGAIF